MGYLSNFDEDVFISYAHNDDDAYPQEQRGWVAQLDEDLKKRIAVFLDGKKPSVWRDPEIRPNEDFEQKISTRLARTATLLSIISPSFFQRNWCIRELEEFANSAEKTFGIQIDEEISRIFKVEKVPVERQNLPDHLQRTGSYKFYGPDPERLGNVHEFRPLLGPDDARAYFRRIDDLAQDIASVLKKMAAKAVGLQSSDTNLQTVYLAETTADLEEEANEIRRDLKDRGYRVLPSTDLPYRLKDLQGKARDAINKSALSIHLVGNEYGCVPEGESERSIAWLQNQFAMERSQDAAFLRLIWMPQDINPTDPRQQKFVNYLRNDAEVQQGADLLEGKIEDLKTCIQESLREMNDKRVVKEAAQIAKPLPAVRLPVSSPAQNPIRIYTICDQADLKTENLVALKKYLFQQNYECILPSQIDDEGEALQEHAENMEFCDACMIYYGHGSAKWFGTKLRDFRKLLIRRQRPVLGKAVYIASPNTQDKDDLETHEAIVLRSSGAFAPESLSSFLSCLRPVL
jgi:hypothetical protein